MGWRREAAEEAHAVLEQGMPARRTAAASSASSAVAASGAVERELQELAEG